MQSDLDSNKKEVLTVNILNIIFILISNFIIVKLKDSQIIYLLKMRYKTKI